VGPGPGGVVGAGGGGGGGKNWTLTSPSAGAVSSGDGRSTRVGAVGPEKSCPPSGRPCVSPDASSFILSLRGNGVFNVSGGGEARGAPGGNRALRVLVPGSTLEGSASQE